MTCACIQSVYNETEGITFELIVVDNDSTDGSPEAIAKQFPQVKLIALEENIGFAAGNNRAAQHALGEYLLLLNPDTVILEGAIQKALAFAQQQSSVGIVGGRTFFGDGSLNYRSCHGRPTPWSMFCMGTGLSSIFRQSYWFDPESLGRWRRDTVREVDAVTGCFLLIPRKLWDDLKGFDPAFFMYGEETDLCLRAQKMGWKAMITPDAKLIHYGGASERVRADKMVRLFQAKSLLIRRHWHPFWVPFGLAMLNGWALSRAVALGIVQVVRPQSRSSFKSWYSIWLRRSEFHRL